MKSWVAKVKATVKAHRALTAVLAGVLVIALTVGLYLFQPWRLFTNRTVNEELVALPAASETVSSAPAPTTAPLTTDNLPTTATPSAAAKPAGPAIVAKGSFRSLEHKTTGNAQLVRLPDGRYVVQFENLSTSDGPDLHVWLSDKPAEVEEKAFKTGNTRLGDLKGNRGNQVYQIPVGTDVAKVRSVLIWCERFSAGFGVAPLAAVAM